MQILVANRIPVPSTYITNNVYLLQEAIQKIGPPPVIIKLLSSTQGLGVIKAESMNSAESIMESFIKLKEKVMLQEFIEESNGKDLRIFIVDNEIVASMERSAKEGEFRSNLHRGATSKRVFLRSNEKEMALKAVQVLGLKVAGVDILRSSSGPLILEVNASPGLEGIETTSHIDIASKIIQFLERQVRKRNG